VEAMCRLQFVGKKHNFPLAGRTGFSLSLPRQWQLDLPLLFLRRGMRGGSQINKTFLAKHNLVKTDFVRDDYLVAPEKPYKPCK